MDRHVSDTLQGYVRIRITGDSCTRFLNLCVCRGIRLWDILPGECSCEANLSGKEFRKLKPIAKKSHVRVRILQRHGFPFFLRCCRRRKAYLLGAAAACLLFGGLSTRVWNITVDGNLSQTDDILFEYLGNAGISHGMMKSQVDCKALADEIRNFFPQFSWVAVELEGTWLKIHVKEGIPQPATEEAGEPCSLAASEGGTVVSIYVRSGLPLVSAGAEVEEGQLLVTGALPVYRDDGEVGSWQYVAADADVVIQTQMEYEDEVPRREERKRYTGEERKRFLLQVGGAPFSFALPAASGSLENCDVTGEITQLRLLEHFYLPVYWKEYTAREYEWEEISYTDEELSSILSTNLQQFVKNLEEKGVQIFENDVKIEWTEISARASGFLTVGKEAVRRTAISDADKKEADADS